ncbi:MAG: aldose 1-epimerase [Planctomycetaceae bacterium]|nr:aldose 1-epimerase [Planctomycetaceae bacterium]
MTPPLVLRDPSSGSEAHLAAHLGFNCFTFDAHLGSRVVRVLDTADDFPSPKYRPSAYGIPILFPFPNRIERGRYTWNGKEYELPEGAVPYDRFGNAIHGFCLDRPWRVLRSGPSFALGAFQLSVDAPDRMQYWPADFLIEVRYEVLRATLRADIRIANPSSQPLPWGFGTHPYFRLPLAAESQIGRCTIEAPVSELWELDGFLPTGRRVAIPEEKNLADAIYADLLQIDDVFTGVQSIAGTVEAVIIDEDAGLQVTQRTPSEYRELVVFTPPRGGAICLEPYTCVTNAVNLAARGLDAGWRVLPPGGEFRTWIEIVASPVLA